MTQKRNPSKVPIEKKPKNLLEGIFGVFTYHYAGKDGKALCGEACLPTKVPESTWGTPFPSPNLKAHYCKQCEALHLQKTDKNPD